MVEAMLGPDTMKKMMVNVMGILFIMLAFIGMILIVYTSIAPTFHAHLWPALLSVGFAGTWRTAKGKGAKMGLAGIAFVAALWILLNSILQWVEPTHGSMALSATGALLIVFGSLVGILGAK